MSVCGLILRRSSHPSATGGGVQEGEVEGLVGRGGRGGCGDARFMAPVGVGDG